MKQLISLAAGVLLLAVPGAAALPVQSGTPSPVEMPAPQAKGVSPIPLPSPETDGAPPLELSRPTAVIQEALP